MPCRRCARLGLVSLAYLWQRDQHRLLHDMIEAKMDAVLVKVAAAGLNAQHIGQPIHALHDHLEAMVRPPELASLVRTVPDR